MNYRERIKGMFLGTAVGDALGLPVETFTPEKIAQAYPATNGRINQYIVPTGHKWFDGRKAGTWTDDTQLTLAVANGLLESGLTKRAIDEQVKAHVAAYQDTTSGWGGTTRQAVKALSEGKSWQQSGINKEGKGKGNGVIMKLSPVACLMYEQIRNIYFDEDGSRRRRVLLDGFCFIRDLTLMTHRTEMAICASFAHTVALFECFSNDFSPERFIERVVKASEQGVKWAKTLKLPKETDDITKALAKLRGYKTMDQEQAIKEWGGGSCYCFHSLPFTYYWFLKNNENIEGLYDCVSAGGDADSNGSMMAAMLGARHGTAIFPQHLLTDLDKREEILSFAASFCDKFGI